MKPLLMLLPATLLAFSPAQASEADFLSTLNGTWQGQGSARRSADSGPIGINCQITSNADAASFSFDGSCRALAIVRQSLSASLQNTGGLAYEGVYVGPQGGRSSLSGERAGDTINLNVQWAEPVNGDKEARMQLEVPNDNTMIIRTIDTSPTTGEQMVTSEVSLTRQ